MRQPSPAWLRGEEHQPLAPPPAEAGLDAVLLDRDGTLNVLRPGYRTTGDFAMLPGAAESVAHLNAAGIPVVLVTNQRGLSTGALSWDALVEVHAHLVDELAQHGAHLDDIRLCPHDEGQCACRKPRPGLIEALLADNPWMEPCRCVLVGDADSDEAAAHAAGVDFVRVSSESGLRSVMNSLTARLGQSSASSW